MMEEFEFGFDEPQPSKKPRISRHQRQAANARERARMSVLSQAFLELRHVLPWVPMDTKLSKLDTLKLATNYIAHLTKVLDCDQNMSYSTDGNCMVWPNSKFRCRKTGRCQIDDNCDCIERYRKKAKAMCSRKRKLDTRGFPNDHGLIEMD